MVLNEGGHPASAEKVNPTAHGLRSVSPAESATWSALRDGGLPSEPDQVGFPILDVTDMQRVTEARVHHEAEAHRKRLAIAAEDVRRAEELESAAVEQEHAAQERREQATEALKVARTILSKLQDER